MRVFWTGLGDIRILLLWPRRLCRWRLLFGLWVVGSCDAVWGGYLGRANLDFPTLYCLLPGLALVPCFGTLLGKYLGSFSSIIMICMH